MPGRLICRVVLAGIAAHCILSDQELHFMEEISEDGQFHFSPSKNNVGGKARAAKAYCSLCFGR